MSSALVACVGLATVDTIVSLPSFPVADGRIVADAVVRSFGGPAATAAVTLARLGHSASMVGAVGDDDLGEAVRGSLAAEGVDVTALVARPGPTAESVILLDRSAATRTILHAPGERLERLDAGARDLIASAEWIHVDHAGHRLVRSLDPARMSVDAGHRIDDLALAGLGLYAPSVGSLLERYPGLGVTEAVRRARAEGAGRVVVTMGADGALVADASGAWRVPGVNVEVVSTLGAGDVFHGALLASLLDGMSLPEAARRANVAAAFSCRALDGRASIPTTAELDSATAAAPPLESVLMGSAS